MEIKKLSQDNLFYLFILLVITIFSFYLFGFTGIRIIIGLLVVSVPFYLILKNFELIEGEIIVFSILMGLTLFSSLVYLFGLVISLRVGIGLTFIILIVISFLIKKFKRKSN